MKGCSINCISMVLEATYISGYVPQFLMGRTQQVFLDSATSSIIVTVVSGVPQRSVMGPLCSSFTLMNFGSLSTVQSVLYRPTFDYNDTLATCTRRSSHFANLIKYVIESFTAAVYNINLNNYLVQYPYINMYILINTVICALSSSQKLHCSIFIL